MKPSEYRALLDIIGDEYEVRELLENGEYSDNWRIIPDSEIDSVLEEELLSDKYVLGCFAPWFIADITGLGVDAVERAQKAGSMEILGELMAQRIGDVVCAYVSTDGYGHHFATCDGEEYAVKVCGEDYYLFRTN